MSHDAGNAPSWIDELGFAKKMALLGGLALLPLAITVSMLLSTALREVRIAQHQQAAVEVVAPLMPLVRSLQDHRGASRAWLAGDQTFKARVEQAQQRVNDAVAATQVTVDTAKDRIDVSKDWASASRFSTTSMTNSGPACTTFLTVQRSIAFKMPRRSSSGMSAGNST